MCFPLQDCPSISSSSSTIDLPLCLDKPSLTAGSQPLTPCLREPGFLLKDGLLPSIVAEQTASWQPPRASALSVRKESSHVVPGLVGGSFRCNGKGPLSEQGQEKTLGWKTHFSPITRSWVKTEHSIPGQSREPCFLKHTYGRVCWKRPV